MSLHETLKEQNRERERAKEALVKAVESRRTDRDRQYVAQVDSLIAQAENDALDEVGTIPPRRDPGRRYQWETGFNRTFHAAMDALTNANGIRTQSHQE